MRAIRGIAAFYILLLSVFPCTDGKTCVDEKMAGIVLSNAGHNHTSGEQDFCSPFCICSCCSAHVQLGSSINICDEKPPYNTEIVTPYFEKPLLNNVRVIWQPPRIS